MCTSVPWLLNMYCQWVAQLLLLLQTEQALPCKQRGHSSQARRDRSAVGSIGNTVTVPFRQHTSADQLVVDALLLLVEIGVEHVVRLVLFGEDRDRVPVVADRLQHRGASAGLVQRQVLGKVEVGHGAPPILQSRDLKKLRCPMYP